MSALATLGGVLLVLILAQVWPLLLAAVCILGAACVRFVMRCQWRIAGTPCGAAAEHDRWLRGLGPCVLHKGHDGAHATPWRDNVVPGAARLRTRWREVAHGSVTYGEIENANHPSAA